MTHTYRKLAFFLIVVTGFIVWNGFKDSGSKESTVVQEDQLISYTSEHGVIIQISNPSPDLIVTSPLDIKGKAPGSWFFEASFPIVLVNWDGLIIGQGSALAQEDWMTQDMVSFTAVVEFNTSDTSQDFMKYGALILDPGLVRASWRVRSAGPRTYVSDAVQRSPDVWPGA